MKFLYGIAVAVTVIVLTSTPVYAQQKVPIIFDTDGNYDDTLALLYLASNPLFDLRAVTLAGAGFATRHGGPINMQRVLQLFDDKKIKEAPVSFGKPTSLSHISAFPLEWRIGIDEFFQESVDNGTLSEANAPLSHHESSDLMAKVLRESDTAVAIAVTGPATNLALALQKEPDLVDRISALFLMGSNYGGGPNNVYSWQMTYDGVTSSCAEDATGHYFVPEDSRRDGCRGNSMSDSGDTEWNVFLDVVAWHYVTRYVAESVTKPPIYAITSGATEAMNATLADFDEGGKYLSSQGLEAMSTFTQSLGAAFLEAGEAKWWDAQLAVAMANIINGHTGNNKTDLVCAEWKETDGFKVNMVWKNIPPGSVGDASGDKNPYGSIADSPGIDPNASFCLYGNVEVMQRQFWWTLAGKNDGGDIADPTLYLRLNSLEEDVKKATTSMAEKVPLPQLLMAGAMLFMSLVDFHLV